MVAPVAVQFDVRGLQVIHWQGHASTGQLPFLVLYQPQPASDHQPLVPHLPGCSHSHWLCRLWQAMTGYLPVVSVAGLLAADTSSEHLPSDALLQTWHRLRLAVLHNIWTASQIAQASQPTRPSDTSEPDAILASAPSPQQASLSSSST